VPCESTTRKVRFGEKSHPEISLWHFVFKDRAAIHLERFYEILFDHQSFIRTAVD